MLVDMNSSHPHYEKLRHIQQCVKTGSDLARQLLGFSSKGEHHAIPVDINNAVRESYEIFGRTKKEITVHLRLEPCVWTVEADPSQIEQVLLNLYINAWQAMPSGGDLFIKTQNLTLSMADTMPYGLTPGPYVRISVTDTGVGIDNSIRDRIFDPFFTTKERGRGTGLGLASAYGIIKNHGGFIKVYSEVGKGAAFNIFLPASVELKAVSKDEPEARVLRGSETLLLVDDEDIILDVGTLMLEELGYTVLRAPNGYKALEVYAQNKDDIRLVILDMIMPDMSGAQVFDALRHMDSQVRILLSTGYSVNGQASEILKKGCNGFIQKPFKLDQLSCKIRDIIDADAYKTEA
jgi:CheY-like chemotaxis protein